MRHLVLLAVFALAGCSGSITTETPPPAASNEAAPPAAPAASQAPVTSSFSSITLSGSSDKVAKFKKPNSTAAIAVVSYRGSDNFAMESLDASGSQTGLLVNTIGSYSGTVLFDVDSDSVAFQVTASGAWKIVVKPLTAARAWSGTGTVTGKGDDVLLLGSATSGLTPATIKNSGGDNFVVQAYTSSSSDLLVNEIGAYNGEVPLPDGTLLISVESTGSWSIRV